MNATVTDLRTLSLEQLVGLYADANDQLIAAITAECDRREKLDRDRRRRRADPEAAAWREAAHAQMLAAESECRGVLLNHRGIAKGIDPWSLWSGPMWAAERYASWELLRFWEERPRLVLTEYRRQSAVARSAQADEAERALYELPSARDLVAMVRESGPESLSRFGPESGIDESLSAECAAAWLGIKVATVYVDRSRGRWPEPDAAEGRSGKWTRRTLVLHRAARYGFGAPGRPRAKRKTT